ncbi:Polyprotein [Phytophthora palmivora]|uniref:Polyprotein n=1 Tax=Phytophthora palmivora TaxID=4796 RepID=A0A2P4YDN0_9STRA|nr:Polyprotein [Phytophthora palmivora]
MDAMRGRRKNEKIDLSSEQVQSFDELERTLSEPPVLAHPDNDSPFHVKMDASDYAVGDDKKERVIAFGGRKLSTAEKMYPTREKELLAALHSMRIWRVYLIDEPFFINTDHRTLQTILEQKTCSQRLARWLNELGSYKPLFSWIPGASNIVADAISRNPVFQPVNSVQHVSLANLLQQLARQHESPVDDSAFLYRYLEDHDENSTTSVPVEVPKSLRANVKQFFVEAEVLYYQPIADEPRRICVPDDTDLLNAILYENYDSATCRHPGYLKTLLTLQSKYYWLHMDRTTRRYAASCEMYQRIKASHRKPAGLLHPLEIPSNRWTNISMDFITGLSRNRHSECDAIMVIVDRLTKRAHFIPTMTTCTAADTARLFRDYHQKLHGLPLSIISDRDSNFTSRFWSELMTCQQTQLQLSSAFRPETDDQTEKTNHFVSDYLRAFVNARHNDWNDKLSLAEFAYNARVHPSIGMEPFAADLGYVPRSADI